MSNSAWPIGQPSLDDAREVAREHVADENGRCRVCEPRGRIVWPCADWYWAQKRRVQLDDPTLEAPDPPAAEPGEASTERGVQPGRSDPHRALVDALSADT